MTLLDAPVFNEARDRRNRIASWSVAAVLLVLLVGSWLVAGRPVDWPWRWCSHLRGRAAVNAFFTSVEKNDLAAAYGVWIDDANWQQHRAQYAAYPAERFQADWASPGRASVNEFFRDLAKGDLIAAYGVRIHVKDWQQRQVQSAVYPYQRFQQDWNNDGKTAAKAFFKAIEKNDLAAAYGIWLNDPAWRLHQAQDAAYPAGNFQADWSLAARLPVDDFFRDLEKNDLAAAYGLKLGDKDWKKHYERNAAYSFDRFQKDWSSDSPDNDYGQIHSHRIAATRMVGNVLQAGIFVNDRKSKAINLDYDPKDHTLSFSPENVQFLEGTGGIS